MRKIQNKVICTTCLKFQPDYKLFSDIKYTTLKYTTLKYTTLKKNHHTNQGKSILACLFAYLDSGEGNREMQEMEVPDVQVPERGNLHFLFKTKHNEVMQRNRD